MGGEEAVLADAGDEGDAVGAGGRDIGAAGVRHFGIVGVDKIEVLSLNRAVQERRWVFEANFVPAHVGNADVPAPALLALLQEDRPLVARRLAACLKSNALPKGEKNWLTAARDAVVETSWQVIQGTTL